MNRRRVGGNELVARIDPRFLFGTRSGGHSILMWWGQLGDQHPLALKSFGPVPWQHFHAVRSRRIDCDMRQDKKVHAFHQSEVSIVFLRPFVNRAWRRTTHKFNWHNSLGNEWATPEGLRDAWLVSLSARVCVLDPLFAHQASSDSSSQPIQMESRSGAPRRVSAL
jgi:hypothetical protein